MQHGQLFAACLVEYGDKKVRGKRITCGKCGSINRVPINAGTGIGAGDDDDQLNRFAARKFSNLGWRVATTNSQHRCPECVRIVEAAKPFAKLKTLQKESTEMPTNGQAAPMLAAPSDTGTDVHAEPPAPMSREDGRVIYAKLNEVYQDERTGYALDWSDKRVAQDLGVPRAWVIEVRDKWFGPDRNAEFAESIAVAKHVVADCKALAAEAHKLTESHAAEVTALTKRITPMLALADKIEKQVAAIEKAMVP